MTSGKFAIPVRATKVLAVASEQDYRGSSIWSVYRREFEKYLCMYSRVKEGGGHLVEGGVWLQYMRLHLHSCNCYGICYGIFTSLVSGDTYVYCWSRPNGLC